MLRLAIAGKGGVGKTTVAALLARELARRGSRVVAVDADPASSLPSALGIDAEARKKIVPVSKMLDLIEERTGARPGEGYGGMFRLNPQVDDILDRYGVVCGPNVRLLVLGTIESGGSGCFCPESTLLRALMDHLVLKGDDVLVIDAEAGLEHLGRASTKRVDIMLPVVEPGMRSVETAAKVAAMAKQVGVKRVAAVLNKVRGEENILRKALAKEGIEVFAVLPFDPRLGGYDLEGTMPFDMALDGPMGEAVSALADSLMASSNDS
ncbi:MAG: protochlorophyllide reductase iron-sulfur ATP-binding protein [Methanomassiliicoccales archaeon PtaU1.Bin124]|nr:MAG: protochlorophyllide reductase iron-sulfur ATP-binding protein [Methanomassiliicoccales archaeon PtaU1.Bin124]